MKDDIAPMKEQNTVLKKIIKHDIKLHDNRNKMF